MHIHVSEKMLQSTKFAIEKNGNNLSIKGYSLDQLKNEDYEKCSLKTFKINESISIENLMEQPCECKPSGTPLLSFKVNTKKTKNITLV